MSAAKALTGKSILIVDDEPDLREFLADEIRMIGASVYEAENGRKAFEIVKNEKIDAIISDIRMPDGDGVELLDRVRSENPGIPVLIFITGYTDLSGADAYNKGAEAIIAKPFNFEQVSTALVRALSPENTKWGRKNDRLPADFKVELKFENMISAMSAKAINVGRGGMFIKHDSQMPVIGRSVDFKIHISENPPRIFEGRAICRWTRETNPNGLAGGIGIEFLELSDETLSTIVKAIEEIHPKAFIPKD